MESRSKPTDSQNRTAVSVKVVDREVRMNASTDAQWTGTTLQVTTGGAGGGRYRVQFEWTGTKKGARPTRITIDGLGKTEITSDLLRALPIRTLKSMDVDAIARIMKSAQEGIDLFNALQDQPVLPTKNPARTVGRSLKPKRELGTRIPEDDYARVAALYKELKALGYSNISGAIADRLFCSASTVRKRIAECRRKGLLPPLPAKGRR